VRRGQGNDLEKGREVKKVILTLFKTVLWLIVWSLPVRAAQEIVTLDTRPGVSMRVLLLTPSASSKGTLVMFPGGDGKDHFTEQKGKVRFSRNFLVRSSNLFVDQGFLVAIVDVPSDQAAGMSPQFRTSKEHTEDIQKVIHMLGEKRPGTIFLVGTSAGTASVAHLAVTLKADRISGIVLTASIGVSRGSRLSLMNLPLEKITLPVLFVHHREDGCWASTFNHALQLRDRMTGSSRTAFIEILGGDPPRSEPCQAMSPHGFLGKEREVVRAITDWLTGKPAPDKIGP
jgi:hypothetical protein